jgi:tagatose-1,6-bisphosphate aldolase
MMIQTHMEHPAVNVHRVSGFDGTRATWWLSIDNDKPSERLSICLPNLAEIERVARVILEQCAVLRQEEEHEIEAVCKARLEEVVK